MSGRKNVKTKGCTMKKRGTKTVRRKNAGQKFADEKMFDENWPDENQS